MPARQRNRTQIVNRNYNLSGLYYIALAMIIISGLYFNNNWITALGIVLLLLPIIIIVAFLIIVLILWRTHAQ